MMTAWPIDLPTPLFQGLGLAPGQIARRWQPDAGPAEQVKMTTCAYQRVSLLYKCTVAQEATLRNFFSGDGGGGGVWFDFTQPFTLETISARFVADNPPSSSASGKPYFDVTVLLEVDGW